MLGDEDFPPVKVALRPDGQFLLRDGRHRLAATILLGRFSTEPLRTP